MPHSWVAKIIGNISDTLPTPHSLQILASLQSRERAAIVSQQWNWHYEP